MQGVHYFVRVSAFNVKGWGPPQCSTPASAAPSSEYNELHTLDERRQRYLERARLLFLSLSRIMK